MGIGPSFGSMSKSTIHLCYDSYLNFIMVLRIVQIKNPTVTTGSLNHFPSNRHRNSPFPKVYTAATSELTSIVQIDGQPTGKALATGSVIGLCFQPTIDMHTSASASGSGEI
jgi:hypothetical protein